MKRLLIIATAVLVVFAAVSCMTEPVHEHSWGKNVVKDDKVIRICSDCKEEKEGDEFDEILKTADELKTFAGNEKKSAILAEDIELSEAVDFSGVKTLDLGGKTINSKAGITNNGDLTLQNGTVQYKEADSFVCLFTNAKKLALKGVILDYEITTSKWPGQLEPSVGTLSSSGESVDIEDSTIRVSAPDAADTSVKLTAFFVSAGNYSIKNSKVEAITARAGDIRGVYSYIGGSSNNEVTGSIENTAITVKSSGKGAVAPVFAESYVADISADIDIKGCTLIAESTVEDNGDRSTYCVRTKGLSTITIDDFTEKNVKVSGNKHEDGKLAKFGSSAQNNKITGVIKNGSKVLSGTEPEK